MTATISGFQKLTAITFLNVGGPNNRSVRFFWNPWDLSKRNTGLTILVHSRKIGHGFSLGKRGQLVENEISF